MEGKDHTITQDGRPTIRRGDADVGRLVDLLRTVAIGQTVSYAALSAAAARDVQKRGRHLLDRARLVVLREDRMLFQAVMGAGLRRAAAPDHLSEYDSAIGRIRATSHRAAERIAAADRAALSPQEQMRADTALTHLALLGRGAQSEAAARLVALAETQANHRLPDGLAIAKMFDTD